MGPFDADLLGEELRHENSAPDSVVRKKFVIPVNAIVTALRTTE